ncbi:UDP-glucose 4-epimerase [Acidocella aminolytica 101 = DSM 11237]|uniref:UDP-glucose 4-epimerase n=3 Tax=Acidocella TaxID=50709 RepID=A0A0D6PCZ6_9PROT|nr:UDP-glucose 4-epimerase [Acidocella aminolytica 101 = DSM 11237]SHF55118.1 UDP-glucose 4-epimerase [Acidocella aminolytica 101 = DSM 11237]
MSEASNNLHNCHLIIGGGGFIGRHVGLALAHKQERVILAGRRRPDFFEKIKFPKNVMWMDIDMYNTDWEACIENVDIIHFYAWGSLPSTANLNPKSDLDLNVGALVSLLDAVRKRGYGRVVFSSSGGTVYGPPRQVPTPETHNLAPINAYGASKATAEIYLNLYKNLYGLDCRIARIANPYGAGQDIEKGLGAVTTFTNKALKNRPIEIWGTGEVIRDFIHISDVTEALTLLSMKNIQQQNSVFNIGSGTGTSLNKIITALEHRLNRKLHVVYKPSRSFDVPSNVLSIQSMKKTFNWRPQVTLDDGLGRMLTDLAEHPDISRLHTDPYVNFNDDYTRDLQYTDCIQY